jgi:hypothetical protein
MRTQSQHEQPRRVDEIVDLPARHDATTDAEQVRGGSDYGLGRISAPPPRVRRP